MVFRNSLKSIYRSFGKTVLFTLLIFSLTLALGLATSVWAAVEQFLTDCDEFYTTIGLFEYMGTDYPGDTIYDPAMDEALNAFNTSLINENSAVQLWEPPARAMGFVEGFWRTDAFVPDRMLSVLVVGNISYSEENHFYSATVFRSLYSTKIDTNKLIYIDDVFGHFESGRYYLIFGEAYMAYSPIFHFRPASFDNAIAKSSGVNSERMLDITADGKEGQYYQIPENSVFTQIAETLSITNNSVLVSGTDNLMSLFPFHQEELFFVSGRPFTSEEYAQGGRVAVISELMAKRLGVDVGDQIDLSVAVSDFPGVYHSYWVGDGFSYNESFEVVGIMNTVLDKSWYVYVPRNSGVPYSSFPIGYTIGHAVIDNDRAAEFYTFMEPQLVDRLNLQIYDQGYSSVAIPYQTILRTAMIITFVCSFVEMAVIILFGYLFVYRQKEASETMMMLGSGKTRVCAYFLISAAVISIFAAVAGAAAGFWLHDNIIAFVMKAAENFTLIDSRYSNGNLTISRTLEFAPEIVWTLFAIVGAIVVLIVILSCLAFTLSTFIKSRPSQKTPKGPKREHRTSRLRGSSLKYTLLSVARGGTRSLVVPILAVSVVIFFGQLATTTLRYTEQMESVYDNTTIQGYYTDINGKQIGNLVLNAYDIANLHNTGQVDNISVSMGEPYFYVGVSYLADGTDLNISPLYVPKNNYVRESLEEAILRGPELTGTNSIRKSPEFFYADEILMSFLDGYDETILSESTKLTNPEICIIPSSLMAAQNIHLGDTIRIAVNKIIRDPFNDVNIYRHHDLRVVGSYEKQGTEDTIYTPLSLFFETELLWGDPSHASDNKIDLPSADNPFTAEQKDILLSTVLNSANFNLKDSRNLNTFKNYLEDYGYSQVQQVGSVRTFLVLKDAAFNNAIASIKQQIQYIDLLYPFLYLMVGCISIVASYLLVVSRKSEFATMRGLGATRARVFSSFFFEQSILCLLGTFVGFLGWRFLFGTPSQLHFVLVMGFVICYFIGSMISITIMNHSKVLAILLDRD